MKRVCRVCGGDFFSEVLAKFENMPKAAQLLPTNDNLEADKGICFSVCQCSKCGLVQLDSEPVIYYREVIRAAAFSKEMRKFRLRQFLEIIGKYGLQGKRILEVGCGHGEYLSLLAECGVETVGLEYQGVGVEDCLAKGLKVEQGFLDKNMQLLKSAPYAAVMAFNFLEHLPDPNAFLQGIYCNLCDEGIAVIEVPNFDMILKNKLYTEFIPDHLFYFTQDSLKLALQINGFEVIEVQSIWQDYILSAIVRKRTKLQMPDLTECIINLKNEINAYLGSFGVRRVAVWGAGHQALTVMALAEMEGKIAYVVDSAPFKQNCFTPATHIPIVAPTWLEKEPVDAIIVMAASYSDEVAASIRKKYPKMSLAILRESFLEKQ